MVSPVGTFFIVVLVIAVVGLIGWVVFTQFRARRLGLPAPPISSYNPFARSEPTSYVGPQPAPSGIRGWISDKWRALRSRGSGGGGGSRSATGAGYERASRRGYALDPDEAWDTRVGHEADAYYGYGAYEEQELGLRGQAQQAHPSQQQQQHQQQQQQPQNPFQSHGDIGSGSSYNGAGYSNVALGADENRGRTLSRSPGVGLGVESARNPFDDDAAEPSNISLRGVSPRPIDTAAANAGKVKGGVAHHHDSPTSERRSIFREDV
ncbi:uncharacterized protein GGS22DRAFT_152788 [Annulohypoxylon maeteangense]|uniref:uncharacterized protein n=1 Tax=Annulohypoxylon maeteangense TaxID=1927788 RepID=UPI0020080141|nr:uncharacterized protein GGS22DRAFT_152788 [Annulohypoxylon maeteangense]KAI0888954.1 hypothetical protein GGS22DRAFT_152788 [Annulohypoxylon maeteangense]